MALALLKCTWRDRFSAAATVEKDGISSLSEAVTAVRVRIEYGHLTEAFMYHRAYCSRVKEQRSADTSHVEDPVRNSWIYHVEVMMTEFCNICIERNYVDKMIELPWDTEEEKHLHKSLFDCAHEMPTEPCGSLLVVYYLRVNILYSYKFSHHDKFSHHERQINCCSENLRIHLLDTLM
jgi:E3 ubiquitin-protein ligase HOS1